MRMPELRGVSFGSDILDCEACALSKIHRLPSVKQRHRSAVPLQRIHSDVMGPISPPSLVQRKRYVVTFVDDFSRFAMVFVMNRKNEVPRCFQQFLDAVRRMKGTDAKVSYLRTDGGLEYAGYLTEILERENIALERAEPDTPTHNGTAERINRTLREKVTAMLSDARMPGEYWEHAVSQAVYLYNRSPHKANEFTSPYEMFVGRKPNLSYIRRFGCLVIYRIPRNAHSKFGERGERGILLNSTETGYRILSLSTRKIVESKDVRFLESTSYGDVERESGAELLDDQQVVWQSEKGEQNAERSSLVLPATGSTASLPEEGEQCAERSSSALPTMEDTANAPEQGEASRQSTECLPSTSSESQSNERELVTEELVAKDQSDGEYEIDSVEVVSDDEQSSLEPQLVAYARVRAFHTVLGEDEQDPLSYKQAIECTDREEWIRAMEDEVSSLKRNGAWVLVEPPVGANIIDSKWVFKRKREANESIRYKARLVIRGFRDREIYDLSEVYSPVASLHSVRTVLALVNKEGLILEQMDVKTAFLNGVLEKPVYMYPPKGMEVDRGVVCKLQRALYGLRISPQCWYLRFHSVAIKLKFSNHLNDPCVYVWRKGSKFLILLLYVDDILLAGNCVDKIAETKRRLSSEFEMSDLGVPKVFLGIEINRSVHERVMTLTQTRYIQCMLKRFNALDLPPVKTPAITREAERKTPGGSKRGPKWDPGEPTLGKSLFREITGSLLHLANGTRPDIAYAVNVLCRHQSDPKPEYWSRAQRLFQYLVGMAGLGLVYRGLTEKVNAYADASVGTAEEGCSIAGYVIQVYGDPVLWRCKKQALPAGSSPEAEYFALSLCSKDAVVTVALLERLTKRVYRPATILGDNRPSISQAKTPGTPKLRHVQKLNYHCVRDMVTQKRVQLRWVESKKQLADVLTKSLAVDKFEGFRNLLFNKFSAR